MYSLRSSTILGSAAALLLAVAELTLADSPPAFADFVLVDKSVRKMWLFVEGERYREYDISLGDNPTGHKEYEGDERTPEGRYIIDYRNPESLFHLSLHISYPREEDLEYARSKNRSPGGNIFIHGLPNGHGGKAHAYKGRDWTDGCIAVDNREIEEIWQLVADGTPIEIRR